MEVISPTITIKVVGFFLGGLNLYILNKMKDAILNGKKNNLYYLIRSQIFNNSFNKHLRLCSYCPRILGTKNSLTSLQHQRRFYYISNIKAINRIGTHNVDVLSVIIGSLLGDASPLYSKKTYTTLNFVPLNPNWITGFTDAEGTFIISIIRSENRAIRWRVSPIFSIKLHGNDLHLLTKIQYFFGVGTITTNKKNGQVIYSVKSIADISSIIARFFFIK